MQILIYIIAIIAIAAGCVLWLSTVLGRWSNEAMDDIIDRDRHSYKDAEREVGE